MVHDKTLALRNRSTLSVSRWVALLALSLWVTACAGTDPTSSIPERGGETDSGRVIPDTGPDDATVDTATDAVVAEDTSSDADVAITDAGGDVAADTGEDTIGVDVVADAPLDTGVDAAPCVGLGCACTTANAGSVCGGLSCVDGVCCESACAGLCRSCSQPGSEGRCTNYAAGIDLDSDCEATPQTLCGLNGECNGLGACGYWGSEASCNDGQACSVGDSCDGTGTCRGEVPSTCGPGPTNECCEGTCTDGAGCTTVAGACADACGTNSLTVGTACAGCGSAGANGVCAGGAVHRCDAEVHTACAEQSCGGERYYCTNTGGSWAWRTSTGCDDAKACTYNDQCIAGACTGTTITCDDTTCATRSCNGTATCTSTPNTGATCDDGNLCTYNDVCGATGLCGGTAIACTSGECMTRSCNGGSTCTETPRTGQTCDDGNLCSYGDTCSAAGVCVPTATITCDGGTTCLGDVCNGTDTCGSAPRNVGATCDDANPETDDDVCLASGVCEGTDGYPPPAEACANGSQSRDRCSGARVISRLQAGMGGWSITDDTCSARNRFDDSGSCWDGNADHAYRIFLREGEGITARLETGEGCSASSWSGTLKLYETLGEADLSCSSSRRPYCEDYESDQTARYVATQDGWLVIVADGTHASDDDGAYRLTVGLACRNGDCSCP